MLSLSTQRFVFRFVCFFAIVFAIEEAVYGRMTLGAISFLIAKTWTEVVLYSVLLIVVFQKLARGTLWKYQPTLFDGCIAAFLIFCLISTFVNDGSLVGAAINVRTMLRYVAIYYIILFASWVPTERQLVLFMKLLVGVSLLQVFLILVQHVAGDDFRDAYFAAPSADVSVSIISKTLGGSETKLGAGYGTLGKTAPAAFFLLLASVVTASFAILSKRDGARGWWLAYALVLVGIYFSYKRAPFLLALGAPLLVAWLAGRRRFFWQSMAVAALVAPLSLVLLSAVKPEGYVKEKYDQVSPAESFAQLFSEDYWAKTAAHSRGWMITEVGRQALVSFKPLGYGADDQNAKAALAAKGGEFGKLVEWGAFDDVYFVAALVYYGPVGVGLLALALYSIYRCARRLAHEPSPEFAVLGVALMVAIILILPGTFVVRLFEFRAFIFPFWVAAGITMAICQRRGKAGRILFNNQGGASHAPLQERRTCQQI
jgi:hypothetical protein